MYAYMMNLCSHVNMCLHELPVNQLGIFPQYSSAQVWEKSRELAVQNRVILEQSAEINLKYGQFK